MSINNWHLKVAYHKEVTDLYSSGKITHRERIARLKSAGITGAENIDLDNAYAEKREADDKLSMLDTFDPDVDDFNDVHNTLNGGEDNE
jgi:hypothetical protein